MPADAPPRHTPQSRAPRALFLAALTLAACAGGDDASHLPSPLALPGQALGNAIGNGIYNARRGRVEAFVKANHPALIGEIRAGGGPRLARAMELAGVAPEMRPTLALRLRADIGLYENSPEALVVALMVHGR